VTDCLSQADCPIFGRYGVSPPRVLYSFLEPSILALSLLFIFRMRSTRGFRCWSGSVEPASTQFRKTTRYSSSSENPSLHALQTSKTGRFAG
jgi:hypothetical protein